jgi:outer membrane autotransporter protein
VNLVAMETRLNGQVRSEQGDWQATKGNAMTFSVEGGFPIGISENWVIEPQAQLINQRVSLISQSTSAANAPSDDLTSWSGRVGARLKGNYEVRGLPVEPYVHTNLWLTYSSGDTLSLGQVDKIASSRNSSTVEVGLGLLAKVSPTVSLFVSGDYSGTTDNAFGLIGNLGVRVRW